jgi:choline kinase
MLMEKTCSVALILAAGMGSRVRTLTAQKPKCLMPLEGRPIIAWIFAALRKAGIRDVVMVTGFGSAALRGALGDGSRYGIKIRYVHNRRWREPNGLSVYAARKVLAAEPSFLAMMSDHLLLPEMIAAVARARTSGCVLAVDTDIGSVFDTSDATKVRLAGGKPAAIGKRLRNYNAVDCGLFRFDGRIFDALARALKQGDKSLTAGVKRLIAAGDLDTLPVAGSFWIDIDTPRAYRAAAGRLDILRKSL